MKTAVEVLQEMKACPSGLAEVDNAGSMRAAWESSTSQADMMWLLGALHRRGSLSRRRLVRVAVRCVETVAHLAPPESWPLLADLSAWTDGDETTIDLRATREALWGIRDAAGAGAAAAADAAGAGAAGICDVIRDEIDAAEICAAMGVL